MFFVLEKRGLKNGEKGDANVAFMLFFCVFLLSVRQKHSFEEEKDML